MASTFNTTAPPAAWRAGVFLIAAGLVNGQGTQPLGQFSNLVDRIKLSYNSVNKTDLDRAEKNIEWPRQYLGKTWKAILLTRGREYKQPVVIDGGRARFATIPWRCDTGTVYQLDNAAYCPAENAISYDGFFLAGLSKKIAQQTHSPGDFAAIVAVAHECGHALQHQLGITATFDFTNEQNADCFAGATARQMRLDGVLHAGDLEEAKAVLTLLADPRRAGPFENNAHGDWVQRTGAFNMGYGTGPEGCAPTLKSPRTPFR